MFTPVPPSEDRPEVREPRREAPAPPPHWLVRRPRSEVARIVWFALLAGGAASFALGGIFGLLRYAVEPDPWREFVLARGEFGFPTRRDALPVVLATTISLAPVVMLIFALAASARAIVEALGRASRRAARSRLRRAGRREGRARGRLLDRPLRGLAHDDPDAGPDPRNLSPES